MPTQKSTLTALVALGVACGSPDLKPDEDLSIGDFGDDASGGDGSSVGDGGGGDDTGGTGAGSGDDGAAGGGESGGSDDDSDPPIGDDGGDGDGDDGSGSGPGEPTAPAFEPDLDVACADGLDFQVHMLDSVVGSCVTCASGADHWVAAAIYNPCAEAFEVSLYDGYLIGGMELVNHTTGEGMGMGSGSTGRVVTETIAPGEWLSETAYQGGLSDGSYSLVISFFDTGGHSASMEFTVE